MTVNGRLTVFYDKCENVNKSVRYSIPYLPYYTGQVYYYLTLKL